MLHIHKTFLLKILIQFGIYTQRRDKNTITLRSKCYHFPGRDPKIFLVYTKYFAFCFVFIEFLLLRKIIGGRSYIK